MIELLVSTTIAALVTVAILAWTIIGFKTSAALPKRSRDNNSSLLLNTYLTRDVAAAALITTGAGAPDCTGGRGSGGTVLASMSTSGNVAVDGAGTRTVYSIAPNDPANTDHSMSLWRRACPGVAGSPTESTAVVSSLSVPAAGWPTTVTCDNPCRQLQFTFRGVSGVLISATATTRLEVGR